MKNKKGDCVRYQYDPQGRVDYRTFVNGVLLIDSFQENGIWYSSVKVNDDISADVGWNEELCIWEMGDSDENWQHGMNEEEVKLELKKRNEEGI